MLKKINLTRHDEYIYEMPIRFSLSLLCPEFNDLFSSPRGILQLTNSFR